MGRNDIRRGKSDTARRRIAVLAYPGAQRAAIHGLIDLFETASRLAATDTKRRTMLMATQWNADDCRGRRGAGSEEVEGGGGGHERASRTERDYDASEGSDRNSSDV